MPKQVKPKKKQYRKPSKRRWWMVYTRKNKRGETTYRVRGRSFSNGNKVFASNQPYNDKRDAVANAIKDGGAPKTIARIPLNVEKLLRG